MKNYTFGDVCKKLTYEYGVSYKQWGGMSKWGDSLVVFAGDDDSRWCFERSVKMFVDVELLRVPAYPPSRWSEQLEVHTLRSLCRRLKIDPVAFDLDLRSK